MKKSINPALALIMMNGWILTWVGCSTSESVCETGQDCIEQIGPIAEGCAYACMNNTCRVVGTCDPEKETDEFKEAATEEGRQQPDAGTEEIPSGDQGNGEALPDDAADPGLPDLVRDDKPVCPPCQTGAIPTEGCQCQGSCQTEGYCCQDRIQTEPCLTNPNPGIWISKAELMELPMSGAAWEHLKGEADQSTGVPDLSNQDDSVNVRIMAKALVFARTNDVKYFNDVLAALRSVTENKSEEGGRTLALGRELAAYVISADLIDLKNADPALDGAFRSRLRELLTKSLDGKTLQSTHEERPNNWGTHAGNSRVAVAVYLNDQAELERAAGVFMGWLGDRNSYAGFSYGDLSWQCDPDNPVGINPAGCSNSDHSIDGVIPDDQRRCGSFGWPPCKTNYAWESLQGALAQAWLLSRQGYPVWEAQDRALLRAVRWLHDTTFSDGQNFIAAGDDNWQPWLVNFVYCEDFPAPSPTTPGKNVGWTDWTHANNPACP